MGRPTLYGADYSVYVRIVRLALHEKQVAYDLVPVDVFARDGIPAWYLEHHPFGKIPAFEHDGLRLIETSAIARYVDEAFPGPALQPEAPPVRAVMNQIVAMLDAYAYRPMVWDVYVERVDRPAEGKAADEQVIAAGLGKAEAFLTALSARKLAGNWLAGSQLTLADLHAAPIFAFFVQAPEGADLLNRFENLSAWWQRMSGRGSFVATRKGE